MFVLLPILIKLCFASNAGPIFLYCLSSRSHFSRTTVLITDLIRNYLKQWHILFPELKKHGAKRSFDMLDTGTVNSVLLLHKYENLILVWFDENLDEEIGERLNCLHKRSRLFSTNEQLSNFMLTVDENYKIILIISGEKSMYALLFYHDHPQVDTILIYCNNDQLYQYMKRNRQYSKVIGIFTHFIQLFDQLQKQIRLILKQFSVLKLFDGNNRSLQDVKSESVEYVWYQLLCDTLMQMDTKSSKQDMLDYVRLYYQTDPVSLKAIDDFEQCYTSNNAIHWYTKKMFLSSLVNRSLKTNDVYALYKLRYFIVDVYKQIKLLFEENFFLHQEIVEPLVVYCGLTLSDESIDELKKSREKYVSTNGFLSTSRSRSVAEIFDSNVVFKIEIDTNVKTNTYAYVVNLNLTPNDEEILFNLGALFQIKDMKYEHDKWIVSMTSVRNDFNLLKKDPVKRERKLVSHQNIRPLFAYGVFLLEIGHYDKSIEYFEKLLKSTKILTEFERYLVLSYLAHAYRNSQQPDIAMRYAVQVFEETTNIMKNIPMKQQHQVHSIGHRLISVGTCYLDRNRNALTMEYYEQVFRIAECDIHSLISLHQLIGYAYYQQGKYYSALEHYIQSMKMIYEYDPKNSFMEAEGYQIIGNIYVGMNKFLPAVEYLEKALALRKRVFPHNHSSQGIIHLQLCSVHMRMKQIDKALEHSQSSINIFETSSSKRILEYVAILRAIAASFYMKKRDYNSAIELYKQSVELDESKHAILHAYKSLARDRLKQGNIDLALEYFEYAFELQQNIKPNDEAKMAYLHKSIGACFEAKRQYPLAMDHYQTSLALSIQHIGEISSIHLARLYEQIGNVYTNMSMKELSLKSYKKALELQETILPFSGTKVLILNFNIGKYYCDETSEYDNAVYHFEKALELAERTNQLETNVNLCIILVMLYEIKMKNYRQAIRYQEKALETQRKIKPYDATQIVTLMDKINLLYEQQHHYLHTHIGLTCRNPYHS